MFLSWAGDSCLLSSKNLEDEFSLKLCFLTKYGFRMTWLQFIWQKEWHGIKAIVGKYTDVLGPSHFRICQTCKGTSINDVPNFWLFLTYLRPIWSDLEKAAYFIFFLAFWINIYECQLYPKHGHLSVNQLKNDNYC